MYELKGKKNPSSQKVNLVREAKRLRKKPS